MDQVRDHADYIHHLKTKLAQSGKVTLTLSDVDTFDQIAQTLNIFRMYLTAFDSGETMDSKMKNR